MYFGYFGWAFKVEALLDEKIGAKAVKFNKKLEQKLLNSIKIQLFNKQKKIQFKLLYRLQILTK